MARLLSPARNQFRSLRTPLTRGEWAVLELFDERLPEEWEIYVQPHLNGLRPDFVLLNPRVGIAVFEVKDWDLDALAYSARSRADDAPELLARGRDGKRFRLRDNPLAKVARYKDAILSLYCPRLGIRAGEEPAILSVVTAGVVMAAATTARAEALLASTRAHLNLGGTAERYHPVAGCDALATRDLATVFPAGLAAGSRFMTADLADDLRSWLIEPDFAAAQRRPLELDGQQRALARSRTATGFRRLKGPAGSGKSTVLAARAAQLSAEGRDVLVVTFNITLWHYLRDLAARYPAPGRRLASRITWVHFHEWCRRVCAEAGMADAYRDFWRQQFEALDSGLADEIDSETSLAVLIERCFDQGSREIATYDAILVDEGQDFNLDWWNCLRRALRPDGEMLLVADETQDLYGRARRWTDETMAGAGFSGGWVTLRTSYRMPPQLIEQLREYVERYLPRHAADAPQGAQLEMAGLAPATLRWIQVEPARAVEACVAAVLDLPRWADPTRVAFTDVTLLVESHAIGRRCVALLEEHGVRCAHVFGATKRERRRKKLAFFMGVARVKASTVHSFKGWETRALVVHAAHASSLTALAAVYVALSRLKRHTEGSFLTVVCSAPELAAYGRTWPEYATSLRRDGPRERAPAGEPGAAPPAMTTDQARRK